MNLDLAETNLYGRIGAIICWHLDNDNMPPTVIEDLEEEISSKEASEMLREMRKDALKEQRRIGKLVGLVGQIAEGRLSKISGDDLFDIWDALGTYPERDAMLDSIYSSLTLEREQRAKNRLNENAP